LLHVCFAMVIYDDDAVAFFARKVFYDNVNARVLADCIYTILTKS
jgi:hypothetical protein